MDWLSQRLKQIGKKPIDLARHLGLPPARVYEMQSGVRKLKSAEVGDVAEFLGWPSDVLLAVMAGHPEKARWAFADAEQQTLTPEPKPVGKPDVPVWASAAAGEDGAIIIVPDPIDRIHRSPKMVGLKDPFSFYVIGESMGRAIRHGDIAVISDPKQPPRAGDDCLFVQEQEDGSMRALVKELVRSTADKWHVRQYQPPKDFALAKKTWPRAYVISEVRRGR